MTLLSWWHSIQFKIEHQQLKQTSNSKVSFHFKFFVSKFEATMTVGKVLVLFISFFLFSMTVMTQNHELYLNYMKCNFSEQFFHPNVTCFAKSYNRSFSGLNMIATTKMPLYNISVSFSYVVTTCLLLKKKF